MEFVDGKGKGYSMEKEINNRLQWTNQLERLQNEAIHELLHYHERSGKQKVKEIIKKAAGRYVEPVDVIFWPTGLIANALTENHDRWQNKEGIIKALTQYYDRFISKGMPIYYMDDVLSGVALIDLYLLTKEEKYKAAAKKMAMYLFRLYDEERDQAGSIPYRFKQKTQHIYVDGIGMMCPFLSKYGAVFGDIKAMEIAILQIENMIKYGMDEKKNLPYHGFMYENKIKYGIIGWGRAVGWLLIGIAGTLPFVPADHEKYQGLTADFQKLLATVCLYQREDGAFSWQLEATEGPKDSSATAMIAWAALTALEKELILTEELKGSCRNLVTLAAGYLSQSEKDGKIYHCSRECLGFSQYPQVYGAYPWSLGPSLSVLLRAENFK